MKNTTERIEEILKDLINMTDLISEDIEIIKIELEALVLQAKIEQLKKVEQL